MTFHTLNQTLPSLPNTDDSLSNDIRSSSMKTVDNTNAKVLPYTTTPLTGNIYIDGLLWGGNHWDVGADGIIEYSFWGNGSESFDDSYGDYATYAYDWFTYEKEAMQLALQTWSNVADISFVQSTDNDELATLGFYLVDSYDLNALGMMNPPGESGMGIGYFNWQDDSWTLDGLQQGGYGFITLIHEVGHGLGLAHPHDDGGGSSIFPGVDNSSDTGDYGLNQGLWTTMTYNDGYDADTLPFGSNYGYQGTPMAFDIAAIQTLYGANMDYNTGDDIYELPTVNAGGTFYSCIWDAGGIDTISAGDDTLGNATINLNDAPLTGPNAGGYLSSVEGIYGGFTIANGVVIENATGGSGDDLITGNEFDNDINGWKGADTLYGEAGDDDIIGYQGADYIDGGVGNDSLFGNSGDDNILGNDGDDYINGGTGSDVLFGNDGDDEIVGHHGADNIDGGAGDDSLSGNKGNDYINGWSGNDDIRGGRGDDTLLGWTGDDILRGGSGSDTLLGEEGNDVLNGYGATYGEKDVLTGEFSSSLPDQQDSGDGADTFVLGNTANVFYNSDGNDGYAIITDFYWAEGDVFQVHDTGNISDYSLQFTAWSGVGAGSSSQDTVISYQGDVIAVVQDTTDVIMSWDFVYV